MIRLGIYQCSLFLAISLWAEAIPEGFVLQKLEPTGGEVLRPVNWYYTARHNKTSFLWTISKENAAAGPYETGMRIQTFINVEAGTGRSPKQFVLEFFEQKKMSTQVIRTIPERNQGLFSRVGLETEEGKYRILYSGFWGNNSDIVIFTIAGALSSEWSQYQDTFNRMANFKLIDMDRFVSQSASPTASQTPAPAKR